MDALKRKKKSRGRSPKPTFQGLPVEKRSHVIATKVEFTLKTMIQKEEILKKLGRIKTVHIIPYDSTGSIEAIDSFSADVRSEKIPGRRPTLNFGRRDTQLS